VWVDLHHAVRHGEGEERHHHGSGHLGEESEPHLRGRFEKLQRCYDHLEDLFGGAEVKEDGIAAAEFEEITEKFYIMDARVEVILVPVSPPTRQKSNSTDSITALTRARRMATLSIEMLSKNIGNTLSIHRGNVQGLSYGHFLIFQYHFANEL
jgi:hypothetical protein